MGFAIQRPETAFSTDPKGQRRPRQTVVKHLAWVRTLPSVLSGKRPCEAAHVRYPDPRFGKRAVGMSEKPDDHWVVPLTAEEHRTGPEAQHGENERAWWQKQGIDPVSVAAALWAATGDDERAEVILKEARP